MVYDEGFDIRIGDYSFFAFSKYDMNNKIKPLRSKQNWVSKCYSTLIGWYHKGDSWGCFYAQKKGVNPEQITNDEVADKLIVVENTVVKQEHTKENNLSYTDIGNLMRFKQRDPIYSEEREISFLENSNTYKTNMKAKSLFKSLLSSEFKDHSKIVSQINSLQKHWQAYSYEEFAKLNLKELNKFAGRSKTSKSHMHGRDKSKFDFKNNKKQFSYHKFLSSNRFPKIFNKWVSYMNSPRNQGHCGSCYAVSTINMLEARMRIKYGIKERFSLDHVLNCSVYNQGCSGGYSYLVLKFGSELEMIPERCSSTKTCSNTCNETNIEKRIFKVENYKYLGGSYGQCSEELLMEELMANGPIVVSFEPDYHFMLYKTGIYKSLNEDNWVWHNLQKPEWEKVDHSVTLVGWGYDEQLKEKYWLLLNSWGEQWGENGYFKMVRGSDHMGIESICEVGDIQIYSL
jgi:C1A family cysteine protease